MSNTDYKDDFKHVRLMQKVVNGFGGYETYGEVHAVIEEAGAGERFAGDGEEVEIRAGTTQFNYDEETLIINGENTTHYIDMDRVVGFYPPKEVGH